MADNYVVPALIEEYRGIQIHHLETSKLQLQALGAAFVFAGALLAFAVNFKPPDDPLPILYVPPVFCATTLVWLHIHLAMMAYRRHVRFVLRPKMENILFSRTPNRLRVGASHPRWFFPSPRTTL